MSYDEIQTSTDLKKLTAARAKYRSRLFGAHGARLTEAQNKYHLCDSRIKSIEASASQVAD